MSKRMKILPKIRRTSLICCAKRSPGSAFCKMKRKQAGKEEACVHTRIGACMQKQDNFFRSKKGGKEV